MKDCTTCKYYCKDYHKEWGGRIVEGNYCIRNGLSIRDIILIREPCIHCSDYEEKEAEKPIDNSKEETAIDYENVRIKAAIAAMREWIRISDKIPYNGVPQTEKSKEIAKLAVNCANDLVEELKNNNANK